MVAESVPARRPALSLAWRGPISRARIPLSVVLVGVLVGLLVFASSVLLPSSTGSSSHAATSKPTDTVSIVVAPSTSALLHPGQDLQVTVTITNSTTDIIPVGTLDLYLAERALTTRSALGNWLRPETTGNPGTVLLSEPTKAEIRSGDSATLGLTVPAASVGLGTQNVWGSRGIAATLTTDGDLQAEGRGTFVWYPSEAATPVNVTVIMPITTPEGSTGLIPAAALETFTSSTGLLSRQLDGVIDRPVAIAIDPMIIASIRILGSSAPSGARDWLDRLANATNDIFPLSYADADIALQAQAGVGTLLAPTSFDQAIDPTLFTTPPVAAEEAPGTASPEPDPTAAPSPTPTPTQTPGAGTPPTSTELLAWNYSATGIGWPSAGVVARAHLDVFAASGLTTTILDGTNVSRADDSVTPNTAVTLGDGLGTGLVTDDALQSAIRAAAMATTDDAWREAMAETYAQLAVVSAEQPGTTRTLLATFARGWPPTSDRLSETLDALDAVPWQAPATLQATLRSVPAGDVSFVAQAEPEASVGLARQLLQREAEVAAFSTALADPVAVTGAHRLDLLALLATSWAAKPDVWQDAIGASLVASSEILHSVSVTTRGPINVVGSKVPLPITLRNELDQSVTVRVQVVPSNGRLLVSRDIESTIDADSARIVTVPVTAAVGSGDVTLRVTLFTPTGVLVNQPALIAVNVQADWEGLGAIILAILVVLFFGFGVWRNIVRRRKERAAMTDTSAKAPSPVDPSPEAPSPAAGVEPHD